MKIKLKCRNINYGNSELQNKVWTLRMGLKTSIKDYDDILESGTPEEVKAGTKDLSDLVAQRMVDMKWAEECSD